MLVAIKVMNPEIQMKLVHWDEIGRIPRKSEWVVYEGTSYIVKQVVTRIDRIYDGEDNTRFTHIMLLLEELK